ncbi:hypothetical protein SEA_LYSIDIOUS_81 [Gordonia phage Lysidious]|nr:hypothetical protein SEA_LYSIDIOUS_81 [Gordonia phage Lysidious]
MNQTYGERLRHLRKAKGWSAQRLSDEIHQRTGKLVPRSTISQYENANTDEMPLSLAVAVCDIFDISLDLFTDRNVSARAVTVSAIIADAQQQLREVLAEDARAREMLARLYRASECSDSVDEGFLREVGSFLGEIP